MALISYKRSQTSVVLRVKILDSSVTTGAGKTGLTSASSGLKIGTIADNESTSTAYTVAGSTIETITTLGTYATPTATKCRFKEVDSTNHPGVYEIQIADARFAVSSAKSLLVSISGATNAAETDVLIPLVDNDPYTANVTAAQIATGVWQDATAGDFTVSSSIGKSLYTGGVAPGGTNGLFIAGTNAATTVTTAFTTTFTGNLTGNVGGNVTGSVGSIGTNGITSSSIATDAITSTGLAASAVTEIWSQAMTELSAVPAVTGTALAALTWCFEMARNKYTETSTTGTLFKDDGSTTLATVTVSDDGTTFTRGKAT